MVLPAPRYLGMRWALPHNRGSRLVLWQWSFLTGRRRVNRNECPACDDGKIEVGAGSDNPECLELARYIIRAERGPRAAESLGARFADEVIAYLPADRTWSLDACSVKEWVDDLGRCRATFDGVEHTLPPDDYTPRALTHAIVRTAERAEPVYVDAATDSRMTAVLAGITGEDF